MTSLLSHELSLSEQKAEEWRTIPGYEGLYEASSLGRIRSAEGKTTSSARFPRRVWKQRIIKPKTSRRKGSKGLSDERVCLWKDGQEKTFLVSRLVAMAFCKFPFEKYTVNHINGDPLDNRAENLEWVTHEENIRHGFNNGLYNAIKKPVILVNVKSLEEIHFDSMSKAGDFLHHDCRYISNAIAKCLYVYGKDTGEKYYVRTTE